MADKITIEVEAVDKASNVFAGVAAQMNKIGDQELKFAYFSDEMTRRTESYLAVERQKAEALRESAKEVDGQRFSFTELNSVLSLVTQGVGYLKQVYDFAEMGAQNQRLIDSGHALAESFGSDMDAILESVKEGSLGTVSELDIIASANRAMMLNVTSDAEKMGELMQVAAFRARSMGISTTQAFNDIVTGIGRNSPLILDNLGIITKGWAEEAKAAGLAYDQQFILNKVLEQGGQMMADAGGFALDAAGEFEKFAAENKNASDELKEMVAEAVLPAIRAMNEQRDTMNAQAEAMVALGMAQSEYEAKVILSTQTVNGLTDSQKELIQQYLDTPQAVETAVVAYEQVNSAIQLSEEQIKELTETNKAWLDTIGTISEEEDKHHEKMTDLVTKYGEANDKLVELTETRWWDVDAIQEQQNKIDELKGKMEEEASSFEENTRRRILSMTEEQLAVGGLTEAETRYLEDLGLKWGIYSQSAIDSARQARAEVAMLVDAFNSMPTERSIAIHLANFNQVQSQLQSLNPDRTYNVGGRQGGGAVTAGSLYRVNETRMEYFKPSTNGTILPMGGGGAGGVSVTIEYNTMMSLGNEADIKARLMPIIIQGVQEAQTQGKIR